MLIQVDVSQWLVYAIDYWKFFESALSVIRIVISKFQIGDSNSEIKDVTDRLVVRSRGTEDITEKSMSNIMNSVSSVGDNITKNVKRRSSTYPTQI